MVKRDSSTEPIKLDKPLKNLLKIAQANEGAPLEELVTLASRKLEIRSYEAAKMIYKLKELGFIRLIDPQPPSSLIRYFLSSYVVWFWLLVATVMSTFLLIYLAPSKPPAIYLRYIFGSLFVLYLPGASLIELLYPKGRDLSQLERLALSIGLSLALVPLVGLILNYTLWGIRLDPIFASLSLLTTGLAAGSVARKYIFLKLERISEEEIGGK